MKRREFITLVGFAAAWPLAVRAQHTAKVPTLGLLYPGPQAPVPSRVEALLDGLRAAGFLAPAQVEIVLRVADNDPSRIAPLAAEIVKSNVDAILAVSAEIVRAFRAETSRIPVVALDLESDPVGSGLAASIARPGGNITGVFFDFPDFAAKLVELLKEIIPSLSHVAVLWDSGTGSVQMKAIEQAARLLAIQIDVLEVRTRSDLEEAFASATRRGAGAMLMSSTPLIGPNVGMLADLAARHRLPTVTTFPDFARAGGLLAYGPNLLDLYRQAGTMVGKVLKGARPADLPIERPDRFQLVLNLQAARALGILMPASTLLRADEVIE